MQAAMRGLVPEPLFDAGAYAVREICPLSGLLAAADCPHRALEHFALSSAPTARCTMHARIPVDPSNGLRAGPACTGSISPVFESYPQQFMSWATSAGRPVAPTEWSPRCPPLPIREAEPAPGVAYPADGSKFFIDPSLSPEQQQIVFVGRAASEAGLRFVLNGRVVPGIAARRVAWPLTRGRYVLHVEDSAGRASDPIHFDVF
jgi:penicillin-binding protein 1C